LINEELPPNDYLAHYDASKRLSADECKASPLRSSAFLRLTESGQCGAAVYRTAGRIAGAEGWPQEDAGVKALGVGFSSQAMA
jgi:hypothetical protein